MWNSHLYRAVEVKCSPPLTSQGMGGKCWLCDTQIPKMYKTFFFKCSYGSTRYYILHSHPQDGTTSTQMLFRPFLQPNDFIYPTPIIWLIILTIFIYCLSHFWWSQPLAPLVFCCCWQLHNEWTLLPSPFQSCVYHTENSFLIQLWTCLSCASQSGNLKIPFSNILMCNLLQFLLLVLP